MSANSAANSAAKAARFIIGPSPASTYRSYRKPNAAAAYLRQMSDFAPTRRAVRIDTLALVRAMEAKGLQSKHAEAITSAITDTLGDVAQSFVSKGELEKDHHFVLLQRASEKLQGDIALLSGKIEQEIAKQNTLTTKQFTEVTKLIADITDRTSRQAAEIFKQITDCTNHTSRIVAETTEQNTKKLSENTEQTSTKITEAIELTTKLDREVIALKAQIPAEIQAVKALVATAKFDGMKYCIGTAVSLCAAAVAAVRMGGLPGLTWV